MEMKSKLYLRIILLSYGMMDIYMIFTVYGFLSEKMSQTKKRERERERERGLDGLISQVQVIF